MSPLLAILQKLQGAVDVITYSVARLTHMFRWVWSHNKITLVYAWNLLYVVCERRQRFQPKQHQRISDIPRSDCDLWFGLTLISFAHCLKHKRPQQLPVSYIEGRPRRRLASLLKWGLHLCSIGMHCVKLQESIKYY